MSKTQRNLIWITLFAISMGYLETSVVVYARWAFFPAGFEFPLPTFDAAFTALELGREVATMLMLVGVAYVAGKNKTERFAWFVYCFAVWDLCYYLFLWVLLDWPQNILAWDLLFLVPVPWTGPVLAPVIVSSGLLVLSYLILSWTKRRPRVTLHSSEWGWLITGAFFILLSMSWDYSAHVLPRWSELWVLPGQPLPESVLTYHPNSFPWWLFALAMSVCAVGVIKIARRRHRDLRSNPPQSILQHNPETHAC